ncbi:hypothetical protein [Aureimonas phyllosphaerae]|uniref:Uncharacterized protein n=1 Tax=Aureimonas phyllosphaerae TaxID=1166078 RepID=A0A7W6BTQ1_9HYPH|nr:hypothetical protein [Aureimonas phyllosphaerae]MBB3937853.1 hypothetical protein [Aureimonas phyllosphaerae]MBB3961816.1 hypothetical protein [Aureimonas phyllosphaerae]SFF50649.1 hypothetical protein SAMN05216566_11913 [Aureimonas phyllosphaerae]
MTTRTILQASACQSPSPDPVQPVSRPIEIDCFSVADKYSRTALSAAIHVDVCPHAKTIVGMRLVFDPASPPPATAAVLDCTPRESSASSIHDGWPLYGLPKLLVIDCPELDAPTFRNAALRLDAFGSGPDD